MVHIEIDGVTLEVEQGSMLIEAADKAGISIPRFCYHKKLSIAANCRMCLVDVEKAPKPLPACATPVSEGMKVYTQSVRAQMAQRAVMEFLLINHPLDCPICDQGGQCELQDVALSYGDDISKFSEGKRSVQDKNIGPLIRTDMTRCIHCTRCVRFGDEVAGVRELGATGRGEFTEIGTYIEKSVDSELSGNVIDLCPVGALTSKPFRYRARAWEVNSKPSYSMHDSLGSNLFYHTQHNKVLRVVPNENQKLNEVWLSDRDRFSYESFLHPQRLKKPLVKINNNWREVEWSEALHFAVEKLKQTEQKHGVEQIGCLISPNSTTEEFYLAQRLMRDKGSNNIDHRLRQIDSQADEYIGAYPNFGVSPDDLENQEVILIIGSDLRKDQPILNARIRKANLSDTKVCAINPYSTESNFTFDEQLIGSNGDIQLTIASVLKSVIEQLDSKDNNPELDQLLLNVSVDDKAKNIAKMLLDAKNGVILLGQFAINHPHSSMIYWLSNKISKLTATKWGELTFGANSAGAWLAGAVPHRGAFNESVTKGLSAFEMCQHPRKGYITVQCEPGLDFASPRMAMDAMHHADTVIALSSFDSEQLRETADCILPITPFSETEGTVINGAGDWQTFRAAVKPYEQSKPGWKVLRVIGELWGSDNVIFDSQTEILKELKSSFKNMHHFEDSLDKMPCPKEILDIKGHHQLVRVAPVPIYHVDGWVRRADSLQKTKDAQVKNIILHPNTANKLGLKENQSLLVKQDSKVTEISLPLRINKDMPEGVASIPLGIPEVSSIGTSFGLVELEPA
jgi:NADH-quinone oxidoreductase subunit G